MDQQPLSNEYWQEDKFLNTLAEAYRLQEAIIGTTELAVLSTNLEGTLTSFNKAAENLLGYSANEVVGKETPVLFFDQTEILHRAQELERTSGFLVKSMFEVLSLATLRNKSPERSDWTFIHKNGRRFPVSLSVTLLIDENDHVFGFAAIATDITEQKAAEKKLKESEAHLNAVLTSMDSSTFEIDENGRYINIWSNHKELGGVPVGTMRNKTFSDLFGKDLAKPFDEIRKKVLASGEPLETELKSPTPGDDRWYSIKYARIHDENCKPTNRISCSISNITKRKKAELALRESEEKFRTMAQNMPGAIYLCRNDETYSMVYLNDKIEEITGFKASQFLSGEVNFVQLYHPEDSAAIIAAVDKALTEKINFDITYRLRHRSAEWRWIKETGTGVFDDDGALMMIEGVIIDITTQKLAEEEFQKIATQNYSIFNNAVNLNAIAGFDGYFKRVNPMWTQITGWTQEELTTRPFLDFVHPEDKASTLEAASYIASGHNLLTFENRYQCKDGTYRWLLWSSASDTRNQSIYATAIDITERKKSEDDLLLSKKGLESLALKLQEQNRQLDEFAHIISHNLRSPIGNIKALIGLLNDKSSIEDYRLIFDKLKNLSVNLGDTMNDLMDTLKVKKETKIERFDVSFKEIMDKVIQSLEGELIRSGASITFDFEKARSINYSRAYMESIMLNLMTNAIKYRSPERKPVIHLETSKEGSSVQLRVRDNGLGIDLQRHGDNLFGLHKTFHGNKEARGVGLFLTKTQIEALGGSIQAISEVGKGTSFIITFG